MNAVLDSSACLAYLLGEPGREIVASALDEGVLISTVNLVEVLSTLADRGHDSDVARQRMAEIGLIGKHIQVILFDEAQALQAARLRDSTRKEGLSLGDRACLALAAAASLPVYTADSRWAGLVDGVEIKFIC